MRIVDYLNSDDDDAGDRHESATNHAPILNTSSKSGKSPRRKLISRLVSFTWKCVGGRVTSCREHDEMEEDELEEDDEEHHQKDGDSDGVTGRSCERCRVTISANQNLTPGCHEQELNFNLVAGVGLLSLVAVCKMELEKIVELRRQMESFSHSLKENCQTKNIVPEPSESPQVGTTASEITVLCDQFSKSDSLPKQEFTEEMEQFENLEEELENELELLQHHLQTDESSQDQWQIREHEVSELVYNQQADEIEQCGVNPYELERRLHELIQSRQEERIRELEAALKLANNPKIQEHKIAACWFKSSAESFSVSR